MDESPNHVTRLVAQIPELVARLTGHKVGCECERCEAEVKRILRVAQLDIDARVALGRERVTRRGH